MTDVIIKEAGPCRDVVLKRKGAEIIFGEYVGSGFALELTIDKNKLSEDLCMPLSVEELEVFVLGLQQILRRKLGEKK